MILWKEKRLAPGLWRRKYSEHISEGIDLDADLPKRECRHSFVLPFGWRIVYSLTRGSVPRGNSTMKSDFTRRGGLPRDEA